MQPVLPRLITLTVLAPAVLTLTVLTLTMLTLTVLTAPLKAQTCRPVLFADGFELGSTVAWSGLAALSDDFEDGDTAGWSLLNPTELTVDVEGGALVLEPAAFSLWFNDSAGGFLWKPLSGDFKMTAEVSARGIVDPTSPPPPTVRLGGLMVRDGEGGLDENYVFVVLGADVDDISVETKTTVDSVSTFQGPPWPSAEGELRICRVGCTLRLYIRELGGAGGGGAWQLLDTFERPDLPGIVQVGPVAYANANPADVQVRFDGVSFERAPSVASCTE